MKCFLVYVDNYDYDEYDSCVILADSEEEVRSMFKRERLFNEYITTIGEDFYFYDHQGEIHIKEVTEKGLVIASFNAG
jgi:DNA-dependent RNA polymerase auxiliary subunit epsilon